MKNLPNKIYLQVHGNAWDEGMTNFDELVEVTWCKDKINDDDIEYVLPTEIKFPSEEELNRIIKGKIPHTIDENGQTYFVFTDDEQYTVKIFYNWLINWIKENNK